MACICPACGRGPAEHVRQQPTPAPRCHEWEIVGDVMRPEGWRTVWRCRLCGVTCNVPAGARGETLASYQRGVGECGGLTETAKEVSRG